MKKRRFLVGIVGKVGSGKSTVAKILEEKYGFIHIDVDKLGHDALVSEKNEIVSAFGTGILSEDGSVDRQKLGAVVFLHPDKLILLNSIVHPKMKRIVRETVLNSKNPLLVIDAALLFDMGLDDLCDFIIAVDAPEEDIIARVTAYRGWSVERVLSVLNSQKYLEFLKEKSHFIIFNSGSRDKLEKQVEFFAHSIM